MCILLKLQMMKIKVLNNIASHGLEILNQNNFEFVDDENLASGIVLRSHDLTNLEVSENLLGIARAGAGTNNINIEQCSQKGVVVFNTPGANANAVKEMVICSLILSKRDLVSGNRNLDTLDTENKDDKQISKEIEAMKKMYVGEEVHGKTLGIIGLGAIGSMVAEQAMSLGIKVNAYDPGLTVETALRLPSNLRRLGNIDEVFKSSDFVTLHLPLNDSTRGIIDETRLKNFKKNSVLVNFSRGAIVNEEAVLKNLDSKHLHKYVTDFPTKNLLQRLNTKQDVMIFPHLGASTKESEINCAMMACSQMSDFLLEGKIVNSVNYPNISSEKYGKHRLFITNKNEPGIISKVAECLSTSGVNVLEFVNKSRENVACNIIDTDDNIDGTIVCELQKISGVTNARLCY